MKRTLLHGGQVVTPSGISALDVLIEGDKIGALTDPHSPPEADERVEVSGKLVFAGFIDPHVHSRDPGQTDKETFAHSTTGAAAGGLTTILEMPNTIPPVTTNAVFEERQGVHEQVARVDFGLWGQALGEANLDEVTQMFAGGAVGVKLFMGYGLDKETGKLVAEPSRFGDPDVIVPPSIGGVYQTFETVAAAGGVVGLHCEDMEILSLMAARSQGRELRSYTEVSHSRPAEAEAVSVATVIEISRATGCRAHILHTSTGRAIDLVRQAQADGVPVTAETCPHFLSFTAADIDAHPHPVIAFPPVRDQEDLETLWQAVHDGTVVSVGSDHAPHTLEEKSLPLSKQPPGAIGVETMARVMLNAALNGRISLPRLADVLSESTAKLYGIYPRKGTLLPGADADISIVDPDAAWEIRNEDLHSKSPMSPWNGERGRGLVVRSYLRGQPLLTEAGLAEPFGRFVPARHEAPVAVG